MGENFDEIEKDILVTLTKSSDRRLQWRDIFKQTKNKHTEYTTDSFRVVLSKRLGRLCDNEYLKKDVRGHKEVYYCIPQEKYKQVKYLLEKEGIQEFVDKASPEQIQNLRHFVERSIQKASGSLGWVITVCWDERGLPVVNDPRKEFSNGEEMAKIILKHFNEFVKQNCEQCAYYHIPDEDEAKFGAPIWCKRLDCEVEPKAIPASYADGCPAMKKA
jgi:hypothetical protein